MTVFDASSIQWQVPWMPLSEELARRAEAELQRELCAGHVLFRRAATAVGCRQDCDDFLFCLGEAAPRFAVVHLTYQRESRPEWPETHLFASLGAWLEQGMASDAADFDS